MPLCQHSPLDRPWQPVSDLNHRMLHHERVKAHNRRRSHEAKLGSKTAAESNESVASETVVLQRGGRSPRVAVAASPSGSPRRRHGQHGSAVDDHSSFDNCRPVSRSPGRGHSPKTRLDHLHYFEANAASLDSPVTQRNAPLLHDDAVDDAADGHGSVSAHSSPRTVLATTVQSPNMRTNIKSRPHRQQYRSYGSPSVAGVLDYVEEEDNVRSASPDQKHLVMKQYRDEQEVTSSSPPHTLTPQREQERGRLNVGRGGNVNQPQWNASPKKLYFGDYQDVLPGIRADQLKPRNQMPGGQVRMMADVERREALESVRKLYTNIVETGKRSWMSRDDCAQAMQALTCKRIYVVEDGRTDFFGAVGEDFYPGFQIH